MIVIFTVARTVTGMATPKPKYAPCENPFLVQRTSVDPSTGEFQFSQFEKRCGTRRAHLCSSCSEIWKDDALEIDDEDVDIVLVNLLSCHGKGVYWIVFKYKRTKPRTMYPIPRSDTFTIFPKIEWYPQKERIR